MSLIDDARKLEVFIYEEGMDYPAPTLEQLQALHDLWRKRWKSELEVAAWKDEQARIVIIGFDSWNSASFVDFNRAIPNSWSALYAIPKDKP